MRAVKLEAVLPEDRQLNLTVPPEIPSGPVEVVILAKDDMDRRASLLNFLDELVSLPPSARTAAAIEVDIAGERQAWDE